MLSTTRTLPSLVGTLSRALPTASLQQRRITSGSREGLIPPHGGKGLVKRLLQGAELAEERKKAQSLRRVDITTRENGDLIMMGIGGFSPLSGFMGKGDWQRVCSEMLLQDGTFWPIPITLSVDAQVAGSLRADEEVALYSEGELMATLQVQDAYALGAAEKQFECQHVFATTDTEHPGVKLVMEQKPVNLGGPVKVLSEGYFPTRFAGIYQRPDESRALFAQRGWKTIAALQLRNPMHRSHEYSQRSPSRSATASSSTPSSATSRTATSPPTSASAASTSSSTSTLSRTRSSRADTPSTCATPAPARPSSTPSSARTTAAPT